MPRRKKPDPPKRPDAANAPPPPGGGLLEELTDEERRFLDLYFASGCTERVESYMEAFPYCRSRAGASVGACNLLQRPSVKAELRAMKESSRSRLNLSASKVMTEIKRLSFSDLGMLEDLKTGTCKKLSDLHPDIRRAIKSVTVVRERTVVKSVGGKAIPVTEQVLKYELWDKPSALFKLAKITGVDRDENPLAVVLSQLPPDLRAAVVSHLAGGTTPQPEPNQGDVK